MIPEITVIQLLDEMTQQGFLSKSPYGLGFKYEVNYLGGVLMDRFVEQDRPIVIRWKAKTVGNSFANFEDYCIGLMLLGEAMKTQYENSL